MTAPDPRVALRDAVATRVCAHDAHAAAAAALERATAIADEAKAELALHEGANAMAEAARSDEIADAIRRGAKPAITLSPAIREAQQKLAEAASRHRMAEAARDQLATELADAEAALGRAEAAADDAALAVVVAHVEAEADGLAALLARLAAIDDLVFGVGHLWHDRHALQLPPKVLAAVASLRPIRLSLAAIRPQRIILTGSSEDETAGRLQAYRAALLHDPEANLDAISPPNVERALPQINQHEADMIAATTRIAAA